MAKNRSLDRHDRAKSAHVIRLPDEEWKRYGEVIGDGGRTADLVAYIRWRIAHPGTPLP